MRIFESVNDNTAYMQGFVAGRKANGIDWAQARLELDNAKGETRKAWDEMRQIAEVAHKRVAELEAENATLKSRLLAYQVSLRNLVDEDIEKGREI